MPVEVPTVLKINIVLVGVGLLKTPNEENAFTNAVGTEVIMAEAGLTIRLPTLPPEPGRKLEIPLDRISLDLTPSRTVIEREYPSDLNDLNRLADVVGLAIDRTELQGDLPVAFGYNFELVYNQLSGRSAIGYLGDKLFGKSDLTVPGWELVGGAGRFVFNSADGRWSIRVDPRFNDDDASRVFLHLNLHKAENRLPGVDEVRASFTKVWEQAHSFASRLDESE